MITAATRAKAAKARADAHLHTPRTTFKGCEGTKLKVGDRVRSTVGGLKSRLYRGTGTVVAIHCEQIGEHGRYTEVGVHFGDVKPEHLTAAEAHAWFRDDELVRR